MATKATGLGWEQKIITKTTGKPVELATLDNEYSITPKKLSYVDMQQIFQLNQIDIDPDNVTGEDVDKMQEKVKAQVAEIQKKGKNIFEATNLMEIAKVAFLGGVENHTFYIPKYLRNPDGSIMRDEDDDMLAEEGPDGKPVMVKSPWDEELYKKCVDRDFQIVMEVYMVVMGFNKTAKKKTSKKSGMRSNGRSKK